MPLEFHTLDVFTETGFAGNPLAVVLKADTLSASQMQLIAREFNLSETVFVLEPENPAHSARVRIFTPTSELPFAGHPTVGTAILLTILKPQFAGGEGDALVVLEAGIGPVRVGVKLRAGLAPYAEFDAPKLPDTGDSLPDVERLAAANGLLPSEIGFENHQPTRFGAGNAFALIPVASLEALGKAEVNGVHWMAAFSDAGVLGAFLYSRECVHNTSAFHARMFAPSHGIPEDPATGSAAICFAGAVHKFDRLPDGIHRRVIEQGFAMGRPSFMTLTLAIRQGSLEAVRLGGHAVQMTSGVLAIDGDHKPGHAAWPQLGAVKLEEIVKSESLVYSADNEI
jgi:trans-2,3-dihydro-3-hydroxyanthranilate isomerase